MLWVLLTEFNQNKMYIHQYKKRVRYNETDKMGYLYYGNYPALYEIGRVEMLRSLGLSYQAMEDEDGIILPVVNLEVRYLQSAYYDEELTIHTIINALPGKLITFKHEIFNEKEQLINKAEVKLFFMDASNNKRISAPQSIIKALTPYFV